MVSGGQQITIELAQSKKIYFASDQHLGAPNEAESRVRELRFVKWLDEIKPNCQALFLLGDLFDFWYEYKQVVPRCLVRTLCMLDAFTDDGIPITIIIGMNV